MTETAVPIRSDANLTVLEAHGVTVRGGEVAGLDSD